MVAAWVATLLALQAPVQLRFPETWLAGDRWWLVSVSGAGLMFVDRETLRGPANARVGWQERILINGNNVYRTLHQDRYDCTQGTRVALLTINYHNDTLPRQVRHTARPAEDVIPGSVGEQAMRFICGQDSGDAFLPAGVGRSNTEAARIYYTHSPGAPYSAAAIALATLNRYTHAEEIRGTLSRVAEPRRSALERIIFSNDP